MEEFNDRAYDAWGTHHWTDEPEQDLPEIDDPRVVEVWEEAEDWGDEYPLPRYARVRVKFKPWEDDDYTETLSYYDYLDDIAIEKGIRKPKYKYTCPELEDAGKVADEFFSLCDEFIKKVKTWKTEK